jgi:hypothetical protein
MVLELLEAIVKHRPPKPPARLSPFTERAYRQAEAIHKRQQEDVA